MFLGGLFQGFEDDGVGSVYNGGVEAGKVDLCGGFTVVSHAFGNYREGYAFGFGGGCPAVSGDV